MDDLKLNQASSCEPCSPAPGTLPVSETFASIQGEGKLTGVPSWFIRVSGCNLRCVWCDTPYASWDPEGEVLPVDDVAEQAIGSGLRHVVLTGGEPMIFGGVTPLCETLRRAGMHITIETAGTVNRDVAVDLMSISPKLANSTPTDREGGRFAERHEALRINGGVLRALFDRGRAAGPDGAQLKLVVQSSDDLAEIDEIIRMIGDVRADEVLLMPEHIDGEPDGRLVAELVRICMDRGWRYCDRLHIRLFGARRGT
jgi:7-carboxy-7-deazaguanine synthase